MDVRTSRCTGKVRPHNFRGEEAPFVTFEPSLSRAHTIFLNVGGLCSPHKFERRRSKAEEQTD